VVAFTDQSERLVGQLTRRQAILNPNTGLNPSYDMGVLTLMIRSPSRPSPAGVKITAQTSQRPAVMGNGGLLLTVPRRAPCSACWCIPWPAAVARPGGRELAA
jgi:hypothetical protein